MNDIKQYLAKIGSKGGASRSKSKRTAARKNGRRGGRPKNQKAARASIN